MFSVDHFQRRLVLHHERFLKLLELREAGNPTETLKAYARALKDDITSDVKSVRSSDLTGAEWQAYRAIHSASCWLGPLLTHDPSNSKWVSAANRAESELDLGRSRIK